MKPADAQGSVICGPGERGRYRSSGAASLALLGWAEGTLGYHKASLSTLQAGHVELFGRDLDQEEAWSHLRAFNWIPFVRGGMNSVPLQSFQSVNTSV